jgi:hypothetical protein
MEKGMNIGLSENGLSVEVGAIRYRGSLGTAWYSPATTLPSRTGAIRMSTRPAWR